LIRILEYKYRKKPREAIIKRLTKYSQQKRNRNQRRALHVRESTDLNGKTSKKNSKSH